MVHGRLAPLLLLLASSHPVPTRFTASSQTAPPPPAAISPCRPSSPRIPVLRRQDGFCMTREKDREERQISFSHSPLNALICYLAMIATTSREQQLDHRARARLWKISRAHTCCLIIVNLLLARGRYISTTSEQFLEFGQFYYRLASPIRREDEPDHARQTC